jgi:glycosyltransferase involved in cell wall biosynthesis
MSEVSVLHTEASNGWGGQEIRILREMVGMRERGYRILLASTPDAHIYRRAAPAGFHVIPVAFDRRRFVSSVVALRRHIRENKVRVINTHSSSDSWIASLAGRLEGVALLRTRHISSKVNGGLLNRFLYGRLCREVMTTGEFIRNQLIRDLKLDPKRVHSVPTGIALEDYADADGSLFRTAHGIPAEVPVLGIAAVLRSWKGHLVLLDAMPSICSAFPEARLFIVGEGPMRPVIEARIRELNLQDRVVMTGYREDIVQAIASFDVAVMASYASEGIPQFALQAMALSKPVVGTRVGGIPEVVLQGETGLLAEPRDPGSLAEAVLSLLRDGELRCRLGENGRRHVASHHSFARMLDDIEACYQRLLN